MNFYKPLLAKSISKSFSGKVGFLNSKWDGFRAIPYVKDNLFTVKSRNGNEFKNNFPELEEITHLTKNVVVDREIVIMKQCKVDFRCCRKAYQRERKRVFSMGQFKINEN
jgi:ATP-dependent DNA ligase